MIFNYGKILFNSVEVTINTHNILLICDELSKDELKIVLSWVESSRSDAFNVKRKKHNNNSINATVTATATSTQPQITATTSPIKTAATATATATFDYFQVSSLNDNNIQNLEKDNGQDTYFFCLTPGTVPFYALLRSKACFR